MANPLPAITFQVDLSLLSAETQGPVTNSSEVSVLHPDMYQGSPDQGRMENSNRPHTRSTWVPGELLGPNRVLRHGDQFTLYGRQALYMKKMYCSAAQGGEATSDRAVLKVV